MREITIYLREEAATLEMANKRHNDFGKGETMQLRSDHHAKMSS